MNSKSDSTSNLSEPEHQRAFKFCIDNLGGCWSKLNLSDLCVRKLSGGLSNHLYHCTLQDWVETQHEPREVLLRLYGSFHGDSQVHQLAIHNQLACENLGPKLYASFHEGRIEEYLPSHPLTLAEMTDNSISATIAMKLAVIHKLDVKCLEKKSTWLIDFYNQFNDFITILSRESLTDLDMRESTKRIATQLMEIDFKPEIEFLERLFRQSKSPLVFSHNDLHHNNIILLNQKNESSADSLQDRVVLIDFEYCSYNYRSFDLANHLMEWCFDYNGDEYPYFSASFERFPSEAQQKRFIAHYLSHEIGSIDINIYGNEPPHLPFEGACQFSDAVEVLYREMQPFLMASNLLWTLWPIKCACTSKTVFGFWELAKWKWDFYLLCKDEFRARNSSYS